MTSRRSFLALAATAPALAQQATRDWTNRDPEITSLLKELGRAGVPLYLYWAPGAPQPKILPQVLTEAAIISELQAKR